ncbi:MAG: hypothetical protein IJN17_08990 [Clostridia bacterium]|nr:hypothetical protein [Clostridia bacterium]
MKQLIMKWFDLLNLPEEWKEEIERASESFDPTPLDGMKDPYLYLNEGEDKMPCLLYSLYKCEDFYNTAKKRDIPDDILLASLSELKRYALEYNKITNGEKLGLKQINWLGKILCGNIYRLGRLEFEIRGSLKSSEKHGVNAGDPVIAVHIPNNGGPFTEEACKEAYKLCEEFFPKYFPEYQYEYYTCNSWLLDPTLKNFLKPESNIYKFAATFEVTEGRESTDALTYLFGRGTELKDLDTLTPETSLQKHVVEHLKNGGKLYSSFGLKKK